jgi:hypothetical protein
MIMFNTCIRIENKNKQREREKRQSMAPLELEHTCVICETRNNLQQEKQLAIEIIWMALEIKTTSSNSSKSNSNT